MRLGKVGGTDTYKGGSIDVKKPTITLTQEKVARLKVMLKSSNPKKICERETDIPFGKHFIAYIKMYMKAYMHGGEV